MNSKNSLLLGRGIFTIVLIVSLGLIVMNEKGGDLFKSKISEKLDSYLESNYSNIKDSIQKEEINISNNEFEEKITSKKNKNLYFIIKYKQKEITDSYKKDYEEGQTLLNYLNQKLEKDIYNLTKINCKVNSVTTLNNYSEKVQERILKEDNLLQLKYYYIEKEFMIDNWDEKTITKEIEIFLENMTAKEITPKYYEIIITNSQEITTSIKIFNITENFLELDNKEKIIKDILDNKNSNNLKENKITYQYIN